MMTISELEHQYKQSILTDFASRFADNNSKLAWRVSAGVLLCIFLIGNFPLVTGKEAPIWDAESFFAPAFTLIADHARVGRIVLWNPWQSGGSPDFAEPELGNASPITVFLAAVGGGTEGGFRLYWLVIWFLGPLGMMLFSKHLGGSAWMSLVVSLGFAFCG